MNCAVGQFALNLHFFFLKITLLTTFCHSQHWECRLLQTIFMYTICASQMWIFVEGLYLHMLIYKTWSTERNGARPYIILGWGKLQNTDTYVYTYYNYYVNTYYNYCVNTY